MNEGIGRYPRLPQKDMLLAKAMRRRDKALAAGNLKLVRKIDAKLQIIKWLDELGKNSTTPKPT